MRKTLLKTIVSLSFLACSGIASAVGFGGINITSALGQPLNAEIDLTSVSPDEKAALTARLASPDVFKNAGIEYPYTLPKIKFRIESRPNGDSYIKLTSDQPVNEPFVSLLVELSWSSGRLLREYTFLLDPPGYNVQQPPAVQVTPIAAAVPAASAPVAAAEPQPVPAAEVVPAVAAASAVQPAPAEETKPAAQQPVAEPSPAPAAPAPEPEKAVPASAPAPAKAAAQVVVAGPITTKRGDTLSAIASKTKPAEVSLERMLVALYRANSDAFDGNNMNRLKVGKVIRLPENEELEQIKQAEALAEIRAQVADWHAYRQKLAAVHGAEPEQAAKQEVQGKIASAVIDKAAPPRQPGKEVLKLSKGEAPGDQVAEGGKGKAGKQDAANAKEEEAVARAKALKEAQERAALLEKNIKDMQRLAELRAQAAQQASAAASSAAAAAASAPASAVAAPAKPKVVAPVTPPAPVEEPSLIDTLLEEPLYLAGLAAVLLALGGGLIYMRRRGSAGAPAAEHNLVEDEGSKIGRIAEPVMPSPETGDFTQMTPQPAPAAFAPASADEVDPIAEADLFLNFGRDVQAEEVLKEALKKDPGNNAIKLKLLSIYATRKDAKTFYVYASEIQQSGDQAAWEQAAAMGRQLEPGNPLYGGSGESVAEPAAAPTEVMLDFDLGIPEAQAAAEPAITTDLPLDFNTAESAPPESEKTMVMSAPVAPVAPEIALDLDLTGTHSGMQAQQPEAAVSAEEAAATAATIDFDITGMTPSMAAAEAEKTVDIPVETESVASEAIDFDVTGTHSGIAAATPAEPAAAEPTLNLDDLVFDVTAAENKAEEPLAAAPLPESREDAGLEFTLDIPIEAAAAEPAEAAAPVKDIGLGEISLNLDDIGAPKESAPAVVKDEKWQEVATKLDLARAYQEMGDQEGAREILEEVLREGDEQQRATAQELMQQLS